MIGGPWKDRIGRIPRDIKVFLVKGLIVFIAWQLLYYLVLQPVRIPDRFLTNVTAIVSAKVLSLFYTNVGTLLNTFKVIITINSRKVLGIADPCNALEIYVLYISFLFCYPAENRRRFLFSFLGVALIFAVNIIRCCILLWLNINHRGWFNISHHYIFTTVIYLVVFYLWMLFSKKEVANDA